MFFFFHWLVACDHEVAEQEILLHLFPLENACNIIQVSVYTYVS